MTVAPHFRLDAWTERWIAMAPGRLAIGATRPGGMPPTSERCPFCPGHESDTEPSTEEIADAGSPWRARSVLNRFPLTQKDADDAIDPRTLAGRGAHEVIVESRQHDRDLAAMNADEALDVLRLWRGRLRALATLPGARAITLFRNKGRRAGSSQPHPHSQIVALPFVPADSETRARVALRHRALEGTPWVRRMIDEERREGARIVSDSDGVIAYCPYASPRAWWARLALEDDVPRFADVDDSQLEILARRLPDLCQRALSASGASDYNVFVTDPPLGLDAGFVLDVVPRTGGDAGFELSTGTSVCVVLPEEAARRIRDATRGAT